MASFGHVAVGLLAARLHGGAPTEPRRPASRAALALFVALSTMPDADIALVALGASDGGPFGHRGAMHSFAMAIVAGAVCAIAARRWHWPVLRTALAGAAVVASHTLLDLLDDGGKSLAILWPLSNARYHLPWRLLPDAPRGLGLLSWAGLLELGTEFALFLPVTIYALWPHVAALTRRVRPSSLRLIPGERTVAPAAASSPKSVERDPSLRSSG